ncbi:hypothetical protein Sjap_005479 [Stephania japonica]|uniref:Glutaredoxin domain-containing protein n=1 Tax=Stephania japonica TaxID=461633 RepID=A0AAP0K418_9MAGN
MGCNSSKGLNSAVAVSDVYRPAAASFALFDINSIDEPWLKSTKEQEQQEEEKEEDEKKIVHVPTPILEKLDKLEVAPNGPHSWTEVSKVLEVLKPNLQTEKPKPKPIDEKPIQSPPHDSSPIKKPKQSKSLSFHTLEELDAKLTSKPTELKKAESMKTESNTKLANNNNDTSGKETESRLIESNGFKSVRENMFLVRDRMEREREGKNLTSLDRRIGVKTRRDPLSHYPEKCPPSGADALVIYTTSLRGVRKTFEDCCRVKSVMEAYRVKVDERDVSLHGEFLTELRNLLGEDASVPRLFIKGRYIGGVDEVVELDESCRLSELLDKVGRVKGLGGGTCEGCGGARFVPCFDCGGSCKVLVEDRKERCTECNENGLVQCPLCH